ncbi:hypothetical protein GW535_17775 (plasmid) [Piscirickettsia salmonis]|uniref:transposase n=1 Tax=Piscirickettsia salmonis TaxID=1238 RepID=UPI00137C061C|nr:hypothetical protein GW535_17775 [Piscirickettsia salmonis]
MPKFWKVHFAQPKENHQHNVDYLGRYIKRPALANARMEHYDGNVVSFVTWITKLNSRK